MPPAPEHFAHSLEGRPREEWQRLEDHLGQTADLAERFAAPFAPGWGSLAGVWHDAGKYRRAFQQMICRDPDAHVKKSVDHSTTGALIARECGGPAALLAFVVAGHHGGMPNSTDLADRLRDKANLLADARLGGLPRRIEEQIIPAMPSWFTSGTDPAALALWIRFLFSALVDGDFLDTEKFYAGGIERDLSAQPGLTELKSRLDSYLVEKTRTAARTAVNEMRARVLEAARTGAALEPGSFTLTVPTGGGKTLASLAFALDHAVRHGLRRVIVVIPYTSIIEQTAGVYREALGADAVVEHHTNLDPDIETRANRLACENWDAPVVVTTGVQFFESLYANRPSRCRKLHRLAESVVVFDEVQTFPVKLLAPVKHVLQELTGHYGSSTLFCTATQPTLFGGAREIVPEPDREFGLVADRCEVLMPANEEPVSWEVLSEELRTHGRVLAIVHRRDDAQRLAELVGEDCFHLSARMCAAHRSEVLGDVRQHLASGTGCRLVATQLVEAGVDIDFPEVYRAFAGADSLAQAAGRCNREGAGAGRLHVFVAPTRPPRGILRTAQEEARTMWRLGNLDLKSPATFREYFARLYGRAEQDSPRILAAERELRFKDVAEAFHLIDETGQSVVAPFGDWQRRVEDVREWGISRERMRLLQPFFVSLWEQEIKALQAVGAIERILDAFWAPLPAFPIYSKRWGFGWKGPITAEPEDLIA